MVLQDRWSLETGLTLYILLSEEYSRFVTPDIVATLMVYRSTIYSAIGVIGD